MEVSIKVSTLCFIVIVGIYSGISIWVLNNIYKTTKVVVDEEFHLPMGIAYCGYNFSIWDSKITTLPGLYLISTLFLAPLNACSVYWLRFISIGAAVLNIPLLYIIFSKKNKNEWHNILSSVTLALIPPVYFFSHLYYTDIVSLTVILVMIVLYEYRWNYFVSLFGIVAILCRQTNVMWIFYLLGRYMLVEMYHIIFGTYFVKGPRGIPLKNVLVFLKVVEVHPKVLLQFLPMQYVLDCCCYLSVISTFLVFIFLNGGIVVGDKTAHEASIHIPQLFYFSLFCLIFGWPHFVGEVWNFLNFVKRHKVFTFIAFMLCLIIVQFNTIVHPYMLADNRHYTFYIWNRFYGKYPSFRFTIIPVYIFALYVICKTMADRSDISVLFVYVPVVIGLLLPQKLIDVRYYFVPYIIFRLHVKNNSYTVFNIILECVTYIILNVITFNIFFTKEFYWSDYEEAQRLIW